MPRKHRLPRLLFLLACTVAGLLVAGVLLAPWLDDVGRAQDGWRRVAALFARDTTLRRTSLASAVGLVVTACVFFRAYPPQAGLHRRRRRSSGVGA
jgi:hypothetical protein